MGFYCSKSSHLYSSSTFSDLPSDAKEGKVTENGWPDDDTTFSPGKH